MCACICLYRYMYEICLTLGCVKIETISISNSKVRHNNKHKATDVLDVVGEYSNIPTIEFER